MTASVPCLCPRCGLGVVAVNESRWMSSSGERRSVWADEPLRCSVGCALSAEEVRRLLAGVYDRDAHQLPLASAPLICTVCGDPLGPATRRVSARPLCAARACRTVRERERRATDPAYRERQRERNRQWAARRSEARALRSSDGRVACSGCGRSFPSGALLRGVCGGPWCPSGQGWGATEAAG